MSAEAFLDTNIFVYQLDASDARKHKIADALVRDGLEGERACISFQVVQECLNTALRKADVALDAGQARAYLDAVLLPLMKVGASAALYQRALDVQSRWRFGFYDSLIVASALSAGCKRLLTEDLQHGQKIETLTIENPFKR
jgi:predicted nucleic acid-binding protein